MECMLIRENSPFFSSFLLHYVKCAINFNSEKSVPCCLGNTDPQFDRGNITLLMLPASSAVGFEIANQIVLNCLRNHFRIQDAGQNACDLLKY